MEAAATGRTTPGKKQLDNKIMCKVVTMKMFSDET